MWKQDNYTGFAIAIAWPETLCKQAGSWYDVPLNWVGINKDHYYKVGHAAVVLINEKNGKCYYFDFGRYHAPFQYGRVRDEESDHDLEINTKAIITENRQIANYSEILSEIFFNSSCHGSGALYASYCKINFEKAFIKAKQMQKKNPIPYGPFKIGGTNCSRFVNTVTISGKPKLIYRLLLLCQKTLTPMPIGNVKALDNYFRMSLKKEALELYSQKHLTTIQQFNEYCELA